MNDRILPNDQALGEALRLTVDLLQNIELSELPLTSIALKTSRLARLLNEFDYQKIMEYESSGYPSTPDGISPDAFQLAELAGRGYTLKDKNEGGFKNYVYTFSIEELEHIQNTAEASMDAARDRNVSISSSNPYQSVTAGFGNQLERQRIRGKALTATKQLAARRAFIYKYVLTKHYELEYTKIAYDIFTRTRERVHAVIGKYVPEAVKKLAAVHDNLISDNPEDWSNAVHR